MNVTSLLSNGYLQPSRRPEPQTDSAALARQERYILAQESALKAASGGAQVSTVYRYAVGPDGRRYIAGALVEITGDEAAIDRVGGGVKRKSLTQNQNTRATGSAEGQDETIRELERTEREVIAHEAAHQAAGGRFAGAVRYTYTQGPDGKSYITGGSVPIHLPASDDPEQALRDAAQVQRAALAPGSPSGQDLGVASQAAAMATRARAELTAGQAPQPEEGDAGAFKDGVSQLQAALRSWEIDARNGTFSEGALSEGAVFEGTDNGMAFSASAQEVYARNASPSGLWSLGRGFEPAKNGDKQRTPLDFAA